MSKLIGIPRSLAYYAFYPLWKTFFNAIGYQVVTSRETNKAILDIGVQETVGDACVPVKLFHGHAAALAPKVDYLFVPRLVKVTNNENETFCPKFLGLPDLLRVSVPNLPPILDSRIDIRRGLLSWADLFQNLGKSLGAGRWQSYIALQKAWRVQNAYKTLLQNGENPVRALARLEKGESLNAPATRQREDNNRRLHLAVVGYPYVLYDRFISVDLLKRLGRMGITVHTMENVKPAQMAAQAAKLPKNLFWHFSNLVVRAALYYLEQPWINGLVHVTSFGCGPDALTNKLIELEAQKRPGLPFMTITIDEHTGEAGLATRLEAFTDMLTWQEVSG